MASLFVCGCIGLVALDWDTSSDIPVEKDHTKLGFLGVGGWRGEKGLQYDLLSVIIF